MKFLQARLANPDHWTRRELARQADGSPCSPISPEAVCWCLLGARENVAASWPWPIQQPVLEATALVRQCLISDCEIASWNDRFVRTHADVLALLDAAITLCAAQVKEI